jgi:hypothetical protein
MTSQRFDYIEYDLVSKLQSNKLREAVEELERRVLEMLKDSRPRSIALTKLEETYMWIGKALRDQQLARGQKDGE